MADNSSPTRLVVSGWSEGPFSERMRANNSRICVNYGYLMDHPVRLQQRSFECDEEFSGVK